MGGSVPHSQGLSNNLYPESINTISRITLRSILILSSHLSLCLPKRLFFVGVPVKILKSTPTLFH